MFEVFQTAVEGLRTAEVRAATAASNIANVRVEIQDLDPNAPASPDPLVPASPPLGQLPDGLTNGGGRDLVANLVQLRLAQHAYEANAVVLRSAQESFEQLLDTFA